MIAIAWCAVLYLLVDAFRLRQRLSGLRVLRSATVQEDSLSISEDGADDYRVWCAEGAHVPDGLVTAAVVHARNEGLVAIDVVPTDWSGLDALAFARRVDTRTFRSDKLMKGVSAACMVVASTRHVERLDRLPEGTNVPPSTIAWLSESLKVAATDRVITELVRPGAPRSVGWSAVVAAGSQASSRAPVVAILAVNLVAVMRNWTVAYRDTQPAWSLHRNGAGAVVVPARHRAWRWGLGTERSCGPHVESPVIQARRALKMLSMLRRSSDTVNGASSNLLHLM